MLVEPKVKFYENELEDDFANNDRIETVKINSNYKYIHKNILWHIASFILYRIIALIPALIYSKIKFHLKIVGREKIKEYRKNTKNRLLYLSKPYTRYIRCYFANIYSFSNKSIYYCKFR